ncbi:MAG: hypothetical protein IPL40_13225 [Proteobacteria bacterium]|nr:hypothetical protein [Pseudomonadota bacterium]
MYEACPSAPRARPPIDLSLKSPRPSRLASVGLSLVGLSRVGLSRVGLSLVGLSLVGLSLVGLSVAGLGCGDEGKPQPGFAAPCDSPMAAVAGCPTTGSANLAPPAALERACERLVTCGILAAEYLVPSGSGRIHQLDYRWCVDALANPANNPCAGTRLDEDLRDAAVACILTTPCTALGLPLDQKLKGSQREPMDRYNCKNNTTVWTATTCDHGLLRY